MTPRKLKAHKYFGQGNKFQGSFKLWAAHHKQKSMGLPVLNHNTLSKLIYFLNLKFLMAP
jgi:hypothetical protein